MGSVRGAVVPGPGQSGLFCPLDEDGSPAGAPVEVPDLITAVAEYEQKGGIRWVWPSAGSPYQALMRAGVRVARCHDVLLADALLRGRDAGIGVQPDGPDEALALLRDAAVARPDLALWGTDSRDTESRDAAFRGTAFRGTAFREPALQKALFEPARAGAPAPPDPRASLDALIDVHADQVRRIAADEHPARFGLLVTAESAGALVAAEMTAAGLPWRPEVHDALLTDLLGPRPALPGQRPARLADL